MINIRELYPGMRLKVVDKFTEHHYNDCWVVSAMKPWLGTIVTVRGVDIEDWMSDSELSVFIEEDADFGPTEDGFYWHADCFEYVVDEEPLDDLEGDQLSSLFA